MRAYASLLPHPDEQTGRVRAEHSRISQQKEQRFRNVAKIVWENEEEGEEKKKAAAGDAGRGSNTIKNKKQAVTAKSSSFHTHRFPAPCRCKQT